MMVSDSRVEIEDICSSVIAYEILATYRRGMGYDVEQKTSTS